MSCHVQLVMAIVLTKHLGRVGGGNGLNIGQISDLSISDHLPGSEPGIR